MKYRYFSENEIKGLSPKLAYMLDGAREIAGIPFIINSGYRNNDHNKKVGGVDNSSHTKGLAVDIKAITSEARAKIVSALLLAGIKRIGIYAKHIHADIDNEKPTPSLWLG
jgi:zinc D-Ala-D-Ala carboxypeptidase